MSLLPPSATEELRAIDTVLGARIETLNKCDLNFNPLTCKKEILPHLAFMYSLDISQLNEKESRELISNIRKINNKKGTRWAILEVLKAVGLNVPSHEAEIVEYKDRNKHNILVFRDGTYSYDGLKKHNGGEAIYDFVLEHWTEYAVIIKVPISESQVIKAKTLIKEYAPKRCVLKGFASIRKQRDGTIFYNSLHTHGLI